MRKTAAWFVAVIGFIVGALVPYLIIVEYLDWGEDMAMKIAAPLALLFAFGGYGLVIPDKDDQANKAQPDPSFTGPG